MEEIQQNCLRNYSLAMRKAISAQPDFDPNRLTTEHDNIVKMVTKELGYEDKENMTYFLNTHWCNEVEHETEKVSRESWTLAENKMCLYVTLERLYVATYEAKLGKVNEVRFGNSNEKDSAGCSAWMGRSRGKLKWGSDIDELSENEKMRLENYDNFLDHFKRAVYGDRVEKEIIQEFIKELKVHVAGNKNISNAMLIIPASFEFKERALLRECCKTAGFKRVVILSNSSIAAFQLFSTVSLQAQENVKANSVLTVSISDGMFRLEILGCSKMGSDIKGIKLLAVVVKLYRGRISVQEALKDMYQRILEQIPEGRRKSIRYYVVLSDISVWDSLIDQYFHDEEKLIKGENIIGENLPEVLSHFSSNSATLSKYLEVLATVPLEVCHTSQGSKCEKVFQEKVDEKKELLPIKNLVQIQTKPVIAATVDRIEYGNSTDEKKQILNIPTRVVCKNVDKSEGKMAAEVIGNKKDVQIPLWSKKETKIVDFSKRVAFKEISPTNAAAETAPVVKEKNEDKINDQEQKLNTDDGNVSEDTKTVTPAPVKVALGAAKLPLKVCTLQGKTYKILAYTNWTVQRLKKEFLQVQGQQDRRACVLQYRARILNDDHSFLSVYKMEPYAVIQANFSKVNLVTEKIDPKKVQDNSKKILGPLVLIGNCLALQNGTEVETVEGVKPGCLVLSRADQEKLIMGEVGLTCKIKGLGDTIYVGVKFRQHLALGSLGIKIQHVEGGEGYCDKCKGRKSVFIPRDRIGKSQNNLFQVQ